MKKNVIQIIEESHKIPETQRTDFRFVIALKPKKMSSEIRLWEKWYGITDTELVTAANANVLQRMRLDAATQVFIKFYTDVYLLEEKNETPN